MIAAAVLFHAYWITVPGAPPQDFGVYHFRREVTIEAKPTSLPVRVSGDNRYQLFVNGQRVSAGPARGDLTHWRYETVDIGPQLHSGRNVLAAVVWNEGPHRAIAQITNETGFLLDADGPVGEQIRTDKRWRCTTDGAYAAAIPPYLMQSGYRAVGPNELFRAAQYPWGWEQPDFDDGAWVAAEQITRAAGRDDRDSPNRWMLVESAIPTQEQRPEAAGQVRWAHGGPAAGEFPYLVGPHAKVSILLDHGSLTTAYPELEVSGGRGAEVRLHYAESLYLPSGKPNRAPSLKGNRNEVEGKVMSGDYDTYVADGAAHRSYRPLYWRTYRYLQVDVETGDEPLTLEALRGTFTAYPFERKAEFTLADPAANSEAQKILETGWRTARLCAHETYMDCPYYEQLQYAGDARIQMMVSLYMTGDSRLMRNGIALLDSSRTAEGATYSRAPSRLQQYIPPFSLWWIGMVHDYWMYVDDPEFVREMVPGVRAVLSFFHRYQRDTASLGRLPWWNFVDWVKSWQNGESPADADGTGAAALDLQLLMGYRWASDLEQAFGSPGLAAEDRAMADRLAQTIVKQDWDASRGLFADQPSHQTYSQQVNSLAVLAHLLPTEQNRAVLEKTLADSSLAQSSIYFRAYTNAALREVGLGDRYWDSLGAWRAMLGQGLSTWAEWDAPDARSDCHAWGASPNFELLRTVAGISSDAPGFKRVRIAPNPGSFPAVKASMPHPQGQIVVWLKSANQHLSAEVTLPQNTEGTFLWKGVAHPLKSGNNTLSDGF